MSGLPSSIKGDDGDDHDHTYLLTAAFRDDSEVHHALALRVVVETSISITFIDPLLARTRADDSRIPPSRLLVDLS
jgi:hypothetical protein